jgi:hypothetical protein
MRRGARRQNPSVGSILEEAQENLLSAFKKSSRTNHRGLKGDARAKSIADFLQERLPSVYGVRCKGEVVDYLDQRSFEIDIIIFDKIRNAVLSDEPLWIPAEALLAYIEVKSVLTEDELRKSYKAAQKISSLKPFKRAFTLAGSDTDSFAEKAPQSEEGVKPESLRCFRTVFAYKTNLVDGNWLTREWERVLKVTGEIQCSPAVIDRILVMNRGMINVPSKSGTDESKISSVFQQWFINLVNFLRRENGRRPPIDWETYRKSELPGWRNLP